jgi:hypothetical protein
MIKQSIRRRIVAIRRIDHPHAGDVGPIDSDGQAGRPSA